VSPSLSECGAGTSTVVIVLLVIHLPSQLELFLVVAAADGLTGAFGLAQRRQQQRRQDRNDRDDHQQLD
jgi:hypothetical protein